MKCNIGTVDRTIRIFLGLAILAIGLILHSWWGLIGLIPLGTALVRWCPLYVPFKISTDRKKKTA
jgi:type IV secretory pathway TrbD component